MKECALVLDGSRRGGGNTACLLDALVGGQANVVTVNASSHIAACQNCGGCLKSDGGCVVQDDMQSVYQAALVANKVVLASPVYFGNLTGGLLDILSRFQCYFRGGFSSLPRVGVKKEGVILLTAGGHGDTAHAERTARLLLTMLNVQSPELIASKNTDTRAAKDDADAMSRVLAVRKRWFGV